MHPHDLRPEDPRRRSVEAARHWRHGQGRGRDPLQSGRGDLFVLLSGV